MKIKNKKRMYFFGGSGDGGVGGGLGWVVRVDVNREVKFL